MDEVEIARLLLARAVTEEQKQEAERFIADATKALRQRIKDLEIEQYALIAQRSQLRFLCLTHNPKGHLE